MTNTPERAATRATARVLLVGARGFGAYHLDRLERLRNRTLLIGLVDPNGGPEEGFAADLPVWPNLDSAFESGAEPDVVIIATPTNTHFALAARALAHGSDVYLEKPPAATYAQFAELLDAQKRSGRAVQVGFQSLGSHALDEIARLGVPTSVAAWAGWSRDHAYWTRSAWAGRRTMNGEPVVDGVLTNPLSHAIATALRIAGARRAEDVASVELDQYRANDIEADDTSSVRITLANGTCVSAALVLTAATHAEPLIEVRTTDTDIVFGYTEDTLTDVDGQTHTTGRTDLFEQLLDHREHSTALSSPLIDAGAFMTVMDAVHRAPAPKRVPPDAYRVVNDGTTSRIVIPEVEVWAERAARSGALFRELRAPFAVAPEPDHTEVIRVDDRVIAVHNDGASVARTSGPRPFLHPVRTLGGVTVTDAHPVDHDWHLGISVALQDVNGANLWGGPTYTRVAGRYRWLDNAGRVEQLSYTPDGSGFATVSRWIDRDGRALLNERTEWTFSRYPDGQRWTFRTSTTLHAGKQAVSLGGPGTQGREAAGYGGFFWRLPAATNVDVRTADARGEDLVHGSTSPWLAFSARFPDGEATVALAPDDDRTAGDPWFVRVHDYPAIGSALAWKNPVVLAPAESLTLSFRGLVSDGRLTDAEVAALLAP